MLRSDGLMQVREHVAGVAERVMRVHFDGPRAAAAPRERVQEAPHHHLGPSCLRLLQHRLQQRRTLHQCTHAGAQLCWWLRRIAFQHFAHIGPRSPEEAIEGRVLLRTHGLCHLKCRALMSRTSSEKLSAIALHLREPSQCAEESRIRWRSPQCGLLIGRQLKAAKKARCKLCALFQFALLTTQSTGLCCHRAARCTRCAETCCHVCRVSTHRLDIGFECTQLRSHAIKGSQ